MARRPVDDDPAPAPAGKKSAKLDAVAARFAAFRPASSVLTRVRAVPMAPALIQVEHALRVGGWPIERMALIHGPSNEGKSTLVLGLILSFLLRGHRALFLDAERTTPIDYPISLMGEEHALSDRFLADKPDNYEAAIKTCRDFLNAMAYVRKQDPLAAAIIAVDSMRKLVPADVMKAVMAEIKQLAEDEEKAARSGRQDKKADKTGRDRRGQIQAKMNAAWMDELTPHLEKAGTAFVGIAREMMDPDADTWAKKAGWDFKIGGGTSLFFEASVVARVERKFVYEGSGRRDDDEDGKRKVVIGEQHSVVVWKTKVAGKDDRKVVGRFFTSNGGNGVPTGFDTGRGLLELAERFDVVRSSGSWFSFGKKRIGQGRDATVRRLANDLVLTAEIEAATRSKFQDVEPAEVEVDEDGVVVERAR